MLSEIAPGIPGGDGWLYEPKWDGFRCIAFKEGDWIYLQSRDAKPLARYFPELAEFLVQRLPARAVVDGEIVIAGPKGLEFDTLQMRLHPAASRVKKLAGETPSSFIAFDLLSFDGEDLRAVPFGERRRRLVAALGPEAIGLGETKERSTRLILTPQTDRPEAA